MRVIRLLAFPTMIAAILCILAGAVYVVSPLLGDLTGPTVVGAIFAGVFLGLAWVVTNGGRCWPWEEK